MFNFFYIHISSVCSIISILIGPINIIAMHEVFNAIESVQLISVGCITKV